MKVSPLLWNLKPQSTEPFHPCGVCVAQMYQGHTLEKTYLGEDFFWAITPTAGDYILFTFDKPVSIERYEEGKAQLWNVQLSGSSILTNVQST